MTSPFPCLLDGRLHRRKCLAGLHSAATRALDVLRRSPATLLAVVAITFAIPATSAAQNAELSGFVRDPQGAVVPGATLTLIDRSTGSRVRAQTNANGIFTFVSVKPGIYDLEAAASGFPTVTKTGVVLNVGERAGLDIDLTLGDRTENVTVSAKDTLLRSTDGSVSTVIDRKFAENLPINGRTFGALLAFAPGVSPATSNLDGGQYSVNGQRASSNYLMVDGVNALAAVGKSTQNSFAGQSPASTLTGGFNGLVSMDALQEIRIQTSTFSPEFGRTPGAQVSLVTRSGTNTFHGSAFEQFRDESLSANNWFLNRQGIPKPELRQHQFGGAVGGPLLRNRSFFFGSYEGLRLLQPRTLTTSVPSLEARQQPSHLQAIFQMYPQPTGPTRADGSAEFISPIYARTTSDTYGLRVDQTLWAGTQAFVRYSDAPSSASDDRILFISDPEVMSRSVTGGLTTVFGSRVLADVRVMYGTEEYFEHQTDGTTRLRGLYPSTVADTALVHMSISGLPTLSDGTFSEHGSSQWNLVGSLSYLFGDHHVKAGIDYRRTSPLVFGYDTRLQTAFQTVNQALAGVAPSVTVSKSFPFRSHFQNVSTFVQDTWKVNPRLSLSYGLRWDINPAPSYREGEGPFPAIMGSSKADIDVVTQRNLPLWKTRYSDIAPRVGFSYAVDAKARTTLSGGIGLFNELSGQAAGFASGYLLFPNGTSIRRTNVPLPLTPAVVQGIDAPVLTRPFSQQLGLIDPLLEVPRTTQWNVTVEQSLGMHQSVSIAYVGARGDRLLQTRAYAAPNPNFLSNVFIVSSAGRSEYSSLQVEYRRRASEGLQILSSYTLGKAEDTSSAAFITEAEQTTFAPSDLDIRHVFNAAVSWNLPSVKRGPVAWALRDWGLHVVGTARSGAPFTVYDVNFTLPDEVASARASIVPGVPVKIDNPAAPRGEQFNRDAFTRPPAGQHGDSPRNGYRGFAMYQIDMGLQRTIPLMPGLRVQVRADVFNVLNTPNFGLPITSLSDARFGQPTVTLNEFGFGAVNALYRQGGPRIAELSLRLEF